MAVKIYRPWPKDGFACLDPTDEAGRDVALRTFLDGVGRRSLKAAWPSGLTLNLLRIRKGARTPDIGSGGISTSVYVQERHAPGLFCVADPDIELLPVKTPTESWRLVNSLRTASAWHRATSDFTTHAMPGEDGSTRSLVGTVFWATVIDPHPESLSLFYVPELLSYGLFASESFVGKVQSLKLRGLGFDLIGEVVTHPALASSAPPRRQPEPTGKGPKLHLAPLTPDEQQRVDEARRAAAGKCAAADMIETDITELLPLWADADQPAREPLASALFELHVRIGDLLCHRLGWSWTAVTRGRSQRFVAVASADRSYAVSGYSVAIRQLESGTPTLQLLLNLIEDGSQLPAPKPDRVTMLN